MFVRDDAERMGGYQEAFSKKNEPPFTSPVLAQPSRVEEMRFELMRVAIHRGCDSKALQRIRETSPENVDSGGQLLACGSTNSRPKAFKRIPRSQM